MSIAPTQGDTQIKKAKIAIVTARFNHEITFKLLGGAYDALRESGLNPSHDVRVPGAFEIPLAAKHLLEVGVDAVVALGAVIRGDTDHYDYICQSVERGCSTLQLEYGKPVVFGILTTENERQALDRAGGKMGNKGWEAAQVAIEMVSLRRKLLVK